MNYKYMFMSFRDPIKNINLGVCIIKSPPDVKVAIEKAWELDINPGGEVASCPLTEEGFIEQDLELNRLYSKQEIINKGFKKVNDKTRTFDH